MPIIRTRTIYIYIYVIYSCALSLYESAKLNYVRFSAFCIPSGGGASRHIKPRAPSLPRAPPYVRHMHMCAAAGGGRDFAIASTHPKLPLHLAPTYRRETELYIITPLFTRRHARVRERDRCAHAAGKR